jgi:8-oxo-dGTP diphosphatase
MTDITRVAVAVIVNKSQQVCISLRHQDVHQGGLWEFPGGKIEQDESIEQALVREIKEELNLDILASRPLISITHQYADKKVYLHVNKILEYRGAAIGVEGQVVKWVSVSELSDYNFPAANVPIIKSLQLPNKYLITGQFTDTDDYVNKLKKALANGIKLVQLRLKQGSCIDNKKLELLLTQTSLLCKQSDAKLMLNIPVENIDLVNLYEIDFDGYHLDSKTLKSLSENSTQDHFDGKLLSASCHNAEELRLAIGLNADFVVLSPVKKTVSHPEMTAMGWQDFSNLIQTVNIPVYALGGVTERDIETAYKYGAQGVSAISAFWK